MMLRKIALTLFLFITTTCFLLAQTHIDPKSTVPAKPGNSFETSLEIKDWKGAAEALKFEAMGLVKDGQYKKSYEVFEKLYAFASDHELEYYSWDAGTALAEMEFMKGNFSTTQSYYEELFKLDIVRQKKVNAAILEAKMSRMLMDEGQPDKALDMLKTAVETCKFFKDSSRIQVVYSYHGLFYGQIGDLDKALEYHLKALEILKTRKDSNSLPVYLKNISDVLINQGNYEKSEDYLKEGLEIAEKRNLNLSKAGLYQSLAVVSEKNGNDLEAITYLEEASVLLGKNRNNKYYNCLEQLAELYQKTGEDKKAYKILRLVLQKGDSLQNFEIQGLAQIGLGNYFLKKKEYPSATKWLKQGIHNFKDGRDNLDLMYAFESLSIAYENLGLSDQALTAYKNHVAIKDSVFNENQSKKINEMETRFRVSEKEHEIAELSTANVLKDFRLKEATRKQLLYSGLVGVLGLLILGGTYLFRLKSKSNQQLAEKNEIISKSLSEKELLIREIHHRVKNNLQVISSLLKLQSVHLSDENALAALDEGRHRVHSMALIHQNLYRDDNVTSIDAADYIETLANSLFESYNIEKDKVRLETDIQPLRLDIDSAIPLGLILNELISNALKHAFKLNGNGLLTVELKEENQQLNLLVSDNGIGIDKEKVALKKGKSFGMELVEMLSEKMEGALSIIHEGGTRVELQIKNYKLV